MSGERWSTDTEITNVLKTDAAGPVLLCMNGKLYFYDGEGHIIYLGCSGCGKSTSGTYPFSMSLIQKHESAVIIDPKGELWANTKDMISSDYEVHVINFRLLYEDVEGWNPLRAPYELWKTGDAKEKYIAEQMIDELAFILFPDYVHSDVFWPHSARSVFIGATYALFETARPEEVNLSSVYNLIAQDERYGSSSYLKEYVKILDEGGLKNKENITMQLQSYISTAEETRGGIRSVFMDGLSIATKNESIRRFLSQDGLNINKLRGDKPTLIYIIIPDENKNFDELAGVLVSQIMSHYIRMAEQDYNGKLPIRLNCVIEETGNVARAIPNLDHYMTASRSRGIRLVLVLQSLSQLVFYGKDKAQTIMANADCLIAFRTINRETLEELSFRCGNKEVLRDGHPYMVPLCTPCSLSSLDNRQALVLIRGGRYKFITKIPIFTEMSISQYRPEKTATVKKSKKTKVVLFDVKEYVKRVKARGMDSRDSRLDAILPKEFKDLPSLSVDDLIKGLEEDSRKLEKEMSEAIEQTERKAKQNKTYRVYVNCIFIDKATANDIAKVISTQTSEDYEIVRAKVIDKQVFDYEFKTLKEARSFICKIKNAGADAWLE